MSIVNGGEDKKKNEVTVKMSDAAALEVLFAMVTHIAGIETLLKTAEGVLNTEHFKSALVAAKEAQDSIKRALGGLY